MKFLQIKQAELAFKDGRLEEACRIVESEEVRDLAGAQKLIGRLAGALTDRARQHFQNGLLGEAWTDCGRAIKLGGVNLERGELKKEIQEAMVRQQQDQARQAAVMNLAQNQLKRGDLSGCEGLVSQLDSDQIQPLRQEAQLKRRQQSQLENKLDRALREHDLQQIWSALKGTDWPSLLERDDGLAMLISRARLELCGKIRETLTIGRIDQAQMLMGQCGRLAADMLDYQELVRVVQKLARARTLIETAQTQEALVVLRGVQAVLPEAGWLEKDTEKLEQAVRALQALKNGPLGLMLNEESTAGIVMKDKTVTTNLVGPVKQAGEVEPPAMGPGITPKPVNPCRRYVVQVDGVGSYLICPEKRLTIGPISSAARPDLGVMAEAGAPVITLERYEEDYLLLSEGVVHVNKKPVTKCVLADHDRIDLTHRVSMRFKKPNPASSSALLDMASAQLPWQHIRYVVLLEKDLVFGPGSGAHIRNDRWKDQVVLSYRDGALYCDRTELVTVRGEAIKRDEPLPLKQTVRAGEVSLVITAYSDH